MSDINHNYVIDESFQVSPSDNGRIRLDPNKNGTPLFIPDLIPKNEKTNYSNALQHEYTPTLLSRAFFSMENIEILQNGIRAQVYQKTNQKHIIDKQDYDQLKIVMRSIFVEHALHKDEDITGQIRVLNKKILDYCVPSVYNELISYLKYKQDISTLAVPLENPIHLTNDKTVELDRFF